MNSMQRRSTRRPVRTAWLAGLGCMLLAPALTLAEGGTASAAPLSIRIEGNHFVDGDGQTVRLLGANHASFEFACAQGWGYSDGHTDDADAAAMASWNFTAARIPLNEDCWLGTNGMPVNNGGADETLTVAGYRQAVQDYVTALNAHGIYAILDLHWTNPGSPPTDGQRPMADSKSVSFWTSVANTFKDNPAVVFDLFNEPYSPAEVNDPAHPLTWSCWRDGGCLLPISSDAEPPSPTLYQAKGMQGLLDAVRATGATQPVMVAGLDYANDLTQWLADKPTDPLGQVAASFHNYQGKACDNAACWNSTIASVAAQVPVVTGEFAQDVCGPSTFAEDYMTWADEHGVGYLMWGWWVLSDQEKADAGCSAYFLLDDYDGTPAAPNGAALHDHLLGVGPGGGGSVGLVPLSPARLADTRVGGQTVDGDGLRGTPLAGGQTLEVKVAGRGGVPGDASAAVLNVTAVGPGAAGYASVYPCGDPPNASNLNYQAGQDIPNLAVAKLTPSGTVCVFSSATTDVIIDVNGYARGSGIATITPARVLDTRAGGQTFDGSDQGGGRLVPGVERAVQLAGRAGVLEGTAAILNVTAVGPAGAGFVTAYPCGTPPNASNLNVQPGQDIANTVVAKLDPTGRVCFVASIGTDLVVDVDGSAEGSAVKPLDPARLLDTRVGGQTVDGGQVAHGPVLAGTAIEVPVAGRGGVPITATTAILNVTAVGPAAAGYATVYPCGDPPNASNLNVQAGKDIPNAVVAKLSPSGSVCVFTSTTAEYLVDVAAYA